MVAVFADDPHVGVAGGCVGHEQEVRAVGGVGRLTGIDDLGWEIDALELDRLERRTAVGRLDRGRWQAQRGHDRGHQQRANHVCFSSFDGSGERDEQRAA